MIISNPRTARSPAEARRVLRRTARLSLLLAVLWLGGAGSFAAVRQARRALNGMERAHCFGHRRLALVAYFAGWAGIGLSTLLLLALYLYVSVAGFGMSVEYTFPS
jgi:hypothetical protein